MKPFAGILSSGILALLVSCAEINEKNLLPAGEKCSLELSASDISFEYGESDHPYSTINLTINSQNIDWEIKDYPDWVEFEPSSGSKASTVTVSVQDYYDFDNDRTADVRIVSSEGPVDFEKVITVTQKKAQTFNELSAEEFSVDYNSNVLKLNISTNCSWTLESGSDWVTFISSEGMQKRIQGTRGTHEISINVADNKKDIQRSDVLKYQAEDFSKDITITQERNKIAKISTEKLEFPAEGGTAEISVEAFSSWKFNSLPTWLTLSKSSGEAERSVITVTASVNKSYSERSQAIKYSDEDSSLEILCTQKGVKSTAVSPTTFTFETAGGTDKITLETQTDWTIENVPSWLHLSTTSGSKGKHTIEIKADASTLTSARSASLQYSDANESISLYVSQTGLASSEVSPKTLSFESSGGTREIVINSSSAWSFSEIPTWIHPSITSGEADKYTVSLTVDANSSYYSRSETLKYSDQNDSFTLSVTQSGVDKTTIEPLELNFGKNGGELTVKFTTCTDWKFIDVPHWVTLSEISGKAGTHNVIAKAEANTWVTKSESMTFSDLNENITISIEQEEAEANSSISPTSFDFTAEGRSSTLNIETGESWSITHPDWITLSQSAGTAGRYSITLQVTDNTSTSARTATLVYEEQDKSTEITVTQEGVEETYLQTNTVDFTPQGGEKYIYFSSATDWSITEIPDWLEIRKSSSSGMMPFALKTLSTTGTLESGAFYGALYITASPNLTYTSRSATLKYSDANVSHDITVNQPGVATTSLTPKELAFTAAAGSEKIQLTAGTSWSITGAPDWLSLSKSSGEAGTHTITVSVQQNITSTPREAALTYSDSNESSIAINVSQEANPNAVTSVEGTHVTVNMEIAGGLGKILEGDYISTTTEITIIGNINGDDFNTLKTMISSHSLTALDMTDAVIVAGGSSYLTVENSFPDILNNQSKLASIKLPNSLKVIEDNAFSECTGLGYIDFGNSLEIIESAGGYSTGAFYKCNNLKELILPDSLTKIGNFAFYNCDGLTKVQLGSGLKTIGEKSFYDCDSIGEIKIPDSVTEIKCQAFYDCNGIASVEFGSGLEIIEESSFEKCTQLKTLEIGVPIIGNRAFYGCSQLQSLTLKEGVEEIRGGAFTCEFYNADQALSGDLVIPSTVKKIGDRAFYGCSRLAGKLIIPDSVTSIGEYAFYKCYGFVELQLSQNLEEIAKYTFYECSGFIGALTIPDSVQSIGEQAFIRCRKFTSLKLGSNIKSIGSYAFKECSGLTGNLAIPGPVTTINSYAFESCTGFNGSLTLNDNLQAIGYCAFTRCKFTGELVIPDSVIYIEGYAFLYCDGFTKLTLGIKLDSIGSGSFSGCDNISSLHIKSTTVNKYDSMNELLKHVTSLTFGDTVEEISANCFKDCYDYTGPLNLPNSLKKIGEYAFSGCTGISSFDLGTGVESIDYGAFMGCTGIQGTVTIPDSVNQMLGMAFKGCTGFTGLVIGNGLQTIMDSTFNGCTSMTSATIGSGLTGLKTYAFNNCSGLSSVTLKATAPPAFGSYCWSGISSPAQLFVPASSVDAYKATDWSSHFEIQSITE